MDGRLSPIRCLTAKGFSTILEVEALESWGTPTRGSFPGAVGAPNRHREPPESADKELNRRIGYPAPHSPGGDNIPEIILEVREDVLDGYSASAGDDAARRATVTRLRSVGGEAPIA